MLLLVSYLTMIKTQTAMELEFDVHLLNMRNVSLPAISSSYPTIQYFTVDKVYRQFLILYNLSDAFQILKSDITIVLKLINGSCMNE